VVGQAFNHESGGGITLSNLFAGWPKDRLASTPHAGQPVDDDVCERRYVLGRDEAVWSWPLSLVRRRTTSPSGADAQQPATTAGAPASPSGAGGPARLLHAGVDALGIRDELRTLRLSEPLRAWIQEFSPDIVYSLLGDLPTMALVDRISREFGTPVVIHMMDDWPGSLYRTGAMQNVVRRHMDRKLRSLVNGASSLLAISDAMAEEYGDRYGRAFVGIHNPVDLERWDALASQEATIPADAAAGMRIMYAGRVGRANADSIGDVAGSVGAMVAVGARIGMDIYTGDWSRPDVALLGGLAGVCVHPGVAYERIPSLMRATDVLLLPLDFDAEATGFARLSMPTKVSEYLASGRPTLTYAPAGSAATEYARAGGWSLVVDRRDPSALRDALATLAGDPALRDEMGARARLCAETHHDARRVREQFRAALEHGAGARHS
jgi:glycosyltransferase involved in cell wall biosynthesis